MSPSEAQALLTICAAFDNRKPDPDAAQAWSLALAGYRFEDCRDAIVEHYQRSREWIMPSDVIGAVKKTRTGRLEDVAPSPPAGMDPDVTASYQRWLAYVRQAIADGREVPQEPYPASRQIGELRAVLRSVPAIEPKPREKSADYDERMAEVKAELAARGAAPMPDEAAIQAALPAPPLQEVQPEPTESEGTA